MVRAQSFKIKYAFAYSARNTKKFCIFERKSVKFFSILLHCIKIYDKIVETKCVKGCEDMRKMHKIFALALGSVLSLSAFAACGGGDVNSTGDAQNYQICFDNLDDSISLDSSATQVAVADANVVAAYDEDGNPVNDWESIATYENGVFTGVSAGRVRYQLSDGTTGSIEVVAAYPTNPDYDYAGNALDFSETGDQGEKVLGRTHDPSLIEVRNERGESIYYMFSTGWSDQSVYNGVTTYGNAIHVSYDGMKTWEFLGRTFDYATRETEVVNSKIGEWLYGDFTSLNNFFEDQDDMSTEEIKAGAKEMASWWAPDVVPKPDGSGYWLYTCVVDGAPQLDTTTSVGGIEIDGETYTRACILLYESETLEPGSFKPVMKDNQPVVLMQSSIDVSLPILDADNSSADRRYYGNVNGIDPQIIYTPDGKMYMAYGSFGSGNYILELDPATGLRKDGKNSWETHETIFGYRDQVEELFTTYEDENGDPWNEDFGHPGGDEDTAVNVFPVYVEGVFNVVRTANELQRALNSGRGVYLMNDIDMEGEALGIGGGSEVNYDSEFRGNGFTVSDFTIAYNVSRLVSIPELDQEGNLLCISLFGNLQGAAISDVTFKDFTMTLDANYSRIRRVYVAPLCMTMKESTVSNVTFEGGVFTCESLTSRLTADDLLVPEDGGAYFVNQDGSTVTNVLCSYENRMPEYFAAQAE